MGYDIYAGESFSGAEHLLTIDVSLFDRFVAAHRHCVPPFKQLARIWDAYGDVDVSASDAQILCCELSELALLTVDPAVRKLCRTLIEKLAAIEPRNLAIFCRGD